MNLIPRQATNISSASIRKLHRLPFLSRGSRVYWPGRVHVKCLIPRRNAAKGLGSLGRKSNNNNINNEEKEFSSGATIRFIGSRSAERKIRLSSFLFLSRNDFCVSRAALSRFSIKRDGGSALVESYRSHTAVGSKRKKEEEGRKRERERRWQLNLRFYTRSSCIYVCVCGNERWISEVNTYKLRLCERYTGIWNWNLVPESSFSLVRTILVTSRDFQGELLESRWKSNIY